MKTALILHGMPSREEYFDPASPSQSNKHWLPWLQRELLLRGILAQTPELPEPYAPVYAAWRAVFEQFHITEETHLIGHSCGAGFLARWLSEHAVKTGKVALVAPFLDPDGDEVDGDFFSFQLDRQLVARTAGIGLFIGMNDDPEILTSADQLLAAWPTAQRLEFPGQRHFLEGEMGTNRFPELAEWILG